MNNKIISSLLMGVVFMGAGSSARAEVITLDETCTVSILNRSVQAAEDGSWLLNNVPSFMGQVRARATCVRNGQTIFGQTDFFTMQQNATTRVGAFETIEAEAVPVSLEFATGNSTVLYGDQTYFRLRVFANYADGSREDVTRISSGINYTISNPEIAQIDINGTLQGLSSGRVLITARKDGTSAVLSVTIVTTGDSDDDGLPDDFEQANGLDANDPIDAFEDSDGDGLSALDEYLAGTDVNNADTDGDNISDGEEASEGDDGFVTNPLLADSDSDGINDGLEVAVGTDPTDINSVNLGASIAGLDVDPEAAVITFNTIQGTDASAQLTVLGTTLDGESIDLTPTSRGTNYTTSDPIICNFGGQDGEVFAGQNGDCTVTADNSGFSDTSDISVRSFDPQALNFLSLGIDANAIDVEGGYAYIGTNDGVIIVDVSTPATPIQVATLSLGTQVADIKVQGQYLYLATSTAALVVVDVTDVNTPSAVTSLGAGVASTDLALSRNQLYVAAQTEGLFIINVSNPEFPQQTETIPAASSINAVAVSPTGNVLSVIDERSVRVFDRLATGLLTVGGSVTLPSPSDLMIEGDVLYVADLSQSLTLIDISDTSAPSVEGITPWLNAGRPNDVVVAGRFAFLADTSFPNGVPIVEVSDVMAPLPRAVIDFGAIGLGGADGYGIDVDNQYIYSVTTRGLQIAQYQQFVDENGIPPTVSITSPLAGESALEGGTISVTAEAQDDVAVASVSFMVDGELIYTDISAPFEFEAPLPIAKSSATISVLSEDFAGAQSAPSSVVVALIADSDYDGLSDDDESLIHGTSPFTADSDEDGLLDPVEISLGYNPLDSDMDNDGALDGEEVTPGNDGYVTNPYDPDSDNDGMHDGFESRFGLNPLDPSDASTDLDGDGFTNLEEFQLGFDPTTADSDSDGMPDEYERQYGLDPLNPNDFFGDIDDDGVPNGVEFAEGTDPTNPDVTAPQVASLVPAGGVDMPANSTLLVQFNEPLKGAALDEVSATMTDASGQTVNGIVSLSSDGYVLSFNPILNLDVNAEYQFGLFGARDLAGNPMAVVYNATITTGELADLTGPRQLASNLLNNATNVPVNTLITFDYDEAIDPTLLNSENFYLYDEILREKVSGGIGVSDSGKQLHFVPDQALLVGRDYYLRLSNVKDLSGNVCSNCGWQRIDFRTAFAADEAAPTVLAATVSDGQSGVPTNARFVVKFDEPISPLRVENVELVSNSIAVDVSVVLSSDRRSVTISPVSLLTASAQYNLLVNDIADISGNSAASYSASFTTGDSADSARALISYWSLPTSGPQNIPVNAQLEVGFNERIDSTSINESTFYLYDRVTGQRVSGSRILSSDGRTLRFTPEQLLAGNRNYRLYVSYGNSLRDLADNSVSRTYINFTTGELEDASVPVVVQSSFEDGATGIPINGRMVVELNEPLGGQCSLASSVSLSSLSGNEVVDVAISNDRRVVTIASSNNLQSLTDYTLTLDGLCDYAGNDLASYSLSFTTGSASDTSAPLFVSITPSSSSSGISVNTDVVMTFNESVDLRAAPPVVGGGITVPGTYSVSGNTITFTPSVELKGSTQYQVQLSRNIADLAGNTRWLSYKYFTTEETIDVTAPTVLSVSPAANAVDVAPGSSVVVTFSEPMIPSQLNSSNIAFYADGNVINAMVYRSADGQQLTLTGNLPQASVVSLVMTDALQDLSGNALSPYVSSFTTGVVDLDGSRPRVTRQIPTNGSDDWFGVNEVVLYTDEPMDLATIESAFHVVENGVLADGTVDVLNDNRAIRFTKATPFAEGARVQVYLESTATDDSGNAVYDYTGYFNMGTSDDRVGLRPTPTAYYPGGSMRGVSLNPVIHVRYNEDLDSALLGDATIRLRNVTDGWIEVAITAELDSTGRVIKITPDALLEADKRYYVDLRDITDTDGDIYTWWHGSYFYTDADSVEDDRQPTVLAISPPDGETGVGVNARYAARFDEKMNPIVFDTDNGQRFNAQFSEDYRVVRYERLGTLDDLTEVTEVLPSLIDMAGNPVVSRSTTFTTGSGPDFGRPYVTDTSIANNQQGVPINPVIEWRMNEAIDPVSVNSGGVLLRDITASTVVSSTITLSSDGKQLQLVPDTALTIGRQYRLYVQRLRDLSGNTMNSFRPYFYTGFNSDVTAPVVTEASVFDGENDVPVNVRLNIKYDEPLNALELSGVQLSDAGGIVVPVNISLSGDRKILHVVPKQLLGANTDYTLTVGGIEDISGNIPPVDYSVSFTTTASADFQGGNVSGWSTASISSNNQRMPLNAELVVMLSERIDPTTLSEGTFYLRDNVTGQHVPGSRTLTSDGRVLGFVPDELLERNRAYRLYVSYGTHLKDLAGNEINRTRHDFTTGDSEDHVSPSVVQGSFADGSTDIPLNGRIVIELDEPLGGQCSLESGVVLSSAAGNEAVNVALSSDRRVLTITSSQDLLSLTDYTLTLDELCDYAGNVLASHNLGFTTGNVSDVSGPSFVSITPSSGSTGVSVNSDVVMVFNEPVDLRAAPPIVGAGITVPGTYSVNGDTVTFTPSVELKGGTQYQVQLSRNIADMAGNTRWLSYRYFTTEETMDITAPTVLSVSPAANAIDVAPGSNVVVTFSEPMDPSQLNSNNIAFYSNGNMINTTVYKSADGQQLTLTGNLPQASVVSMVMTDALQDLSGNALSPYVGSFTTGVVDRDGARPSVTRQLPANGSNDWFGVNEIVLYTNEPMDAASIQGALFVAENGVLVSGTVDVLNDNRAIRFTKATPFAEGALVQVYLEGAAMDDSGNAVHDYSGYFNMGSSDDRVGLHPSPTAYFPGNNMNGVALNPVIHVRYNEELDSVLLSDATIRLRNVTDGWIEVPVTASLDSTGFVIKVTPDVLLEAGKRYYVDLRSVTDTDGDIYTWWHGSYFNTDADSVEDNRQPTVLAISPPDGETGVGVNARYAARFDESMNPIVFDSDGGQRFNAQFSEDNRVVRYERLGTLGSSTEVTETLPVLVDGAGNPMVSVSTAFTTGTGPDFERPYIANASIIGGQLDVPTNPVIEWAFNEAIDPISLSSSGVYLRDTTDSSIIASTLALSSDGKRLQLVPESALNTERRYRLYVRYLRDLSGNSMNNDSRYFTTGASTDVTAPAVVVASVFDGENDVPINARLNVQYNESLNALTLSGVRLTDAGGSAVAVNISMSSDRRTLHVVPKQLLVANSDYTLTVGGVEDLSGNTPATDYSVSFTTTANADFAQGNITDWSISINGAQGVPLNTELVVILSERVDPSTINEGSFYLYDMTSRQNVSGSRTVSSDGRRLTFEPDLVLESNRSYRLYVSNADRLRDLAGNQVSWGYRSFSTGEAEDHMVPSVELSSFVDGTTDVPVNSRIVIEISETLGGQCSLASGVVLSSASGSEALNISPDSTRQTLVITPGNNLLAATSYTMTLSGLCDYAGNNLPQYTLGFTTRNSSSEDNTFPNYLGSVPAHEETGVTADSTIVLNFDEQVDLTMAWRQITVDGGVTTGVFQATGTGALIFTPDDLFAAGSQHTVFIGYAYDLVGNRRYIGRTISFTVEGE